MTAKQDQLFKKALSETYKYAALLHVKDYATLSFNDVARAIKESNEFRGIRTADVQHLAESVTKHLKESVMSEIDLAISDAKADGLDDAAIARDLAAKYRIGLTDAEHLVAQWTADNLDENFSGAIAEVGYADALGNLNMPHSEIIAAAQSDGTVSQRPVMKFEKDGSTVYFFESNNDIDALVLLSGNNLKAIKNFTGEKGLVFALLNYIVSMKGVEVRIDASEPLSPEGFKWVAALIKNKAGLRVRDQAGQEVDVDALEAEWKRSKSGHGEESGPTGLVITESSKSWTAKLLENEKRVMPFAYFNVTAPRQINEATSALAQWKQKVKAAHPTATFEVRKKTDRYGSDRVEANVGDRMVGYFEKKSGRSNILEAAEKSIKVYHVDRDGKKGYTVVDSAAALQDHIRGLKRTGAKITHTASVVNGQEGPAVYPKAAQVDEALDKHSFLGRIQRKHQLKKKVDQTWQDAVDAEKRGDEKAKNRSFEKHVRYTNLERPGTWTKVKEELDDQLASFAPGDRVRVMNARRYDSMALSNEVEGEVIFVFPDGTVAVAIGTGQSNVEPQDVVKLDTNEAAVAETTTNYDNMSDWENHANRLGCQIRKDNKTGTLHAYLNGDHCGEYFTHGKLQGTGRIVEKAQQMNESFPYDVDHMPGAVIRNADMATDSVYTKDYAQWKRAVNSINRRVFDDNASLISDSNREIALNDDGDILWAQWDKKKNSGWFNSKGRQVRPYPVKENVSGAIAEANPGSRVEIVSGPSMHIGKTGTIGTPQPHHAKPGYVLVNLDHGAGSVLLPKAAVAVKEAFPHDVDHMPGRRVAYQNTNCRKCHGRKFMYKLDGKLYADNKKGAVRVKCPACKGTGDISESGVISNNSVKVGDKIRTIKMGQIPGVVEKIDGDWVIFRHESGKLYRAPASNVRLDEARSQPFNQFGPQPKRRQTAQQKAIAQRNKAYWDAQPVIEPKDQHVGVARVIRNDPEVVEEMTPTQTRERERIVKGMKKNKADFKDRYGKRGEEVMYATATKRAMGEDSDDQYQQGLRSAIEILRRANQEFQRTGDRSVLDRAHREYGKVYDQLVAANPEAHSRHAATRQVWGPAGTNESAGSIIDSRAYNQLMDMVPDSIKRRYGIDAVARATERAVDGLEGDATVRDVIQWLKHDEESRGEAEDWHELQRLPRNRLPRGRW